MTVSAPDAPVFVAPPIEITLRNPVQEHFEAFAVGNAVAWEKMACADLQQHAPVAYAALQALPEDMDRVTFMNAFHDAVRDHAQQPHVVKEHEATGQHVVICGAGPSLATHAAEWCPQADQIWGCNSALTWLQEHNLKPTHGFCVDQTPTMLKEWYTAPDVTYFVASTVHPHLVEFLTARHRLVRFFNNYVGIAGDNIAFKDEWLSREDWLYCVLFPPTCRAGSGLNSVNRAVDVALYMGFDRITVLGADCALQLKRPKPAHYVHGDRRHRRWLEKHTVMHASGSSAIVNGQSAITLGGMIDGRHWESKPDLIVSAVWLEMQRRQSNGIIEVIGDTLPNALRDKPEAFLQKLPSIEGPDGKNLLF